MRHPILVASLFLFTAAPALADEAGAERTWKAKCGSCHGNDGKAQTEKGKKMEMRDIASAEFQKASDEDMKKAINDGLKKDKGGVKQEMEGFKEDIKAPEVEALVKYMREFKK